MNDELTSHIAKGEQALAVGDTLLALMHFETAARLSPQPDIQSALAYCLAKERRQYQKALGLCRDALGAAPHDPRHYFHLGRIHLLANQKTQAIAVFRRGLKVRRYQPIIEELRRLGIRRPPLFAALPREHLLNRSLGVVLTRIGLR